MALPPPLLPSPPPPPQPRWELLYQLAQSTHSCAHLPGCVLCRHSAYTATHGDVDSDVFAYCLQCAAGFERDAYNGECTAKRRDVMLSNALHVLAPSDRVDGLMQH